MADSEGCGAVNSIAPDMQRIHQSCFKIWLQEKLTFIHITYCIMPFKFHDLYSTKTHFHSYYIFNAF